MSKIVICDDCPLMEDGEYGLYCGGKFDLYFYWPKGAKMGIAISKNCELESVIFKSHTFTPPEFAIQDTTDDDFFVPS